MDIKLYTALISFVSKIYYLLHWEDIWEIQDAESQLQPNVQRGLQHLRCISQELQQYCNDLVRETKGVPGEKEDNKELQN